MHQAHIPCKVTRFSITERLIPAWRQTSNMRLLPLKVSVALIFTIALCLSTLSAIAQGSASSNIVGHITDLSGAVVPGAIVHVTNTATGAERSATTNDSGEYSLTNMPPANYKLTVERAGFKTSTIPSLDLLVDKTADASVVLSVGATTETVEVTTLPQQLQTTEATVGQVIDQKQVNELPLNGRNVLQLATLAAGVSPAQTANTGSPAQVGNRSLYITVDGGRASSTNYVMDGVYVRSLRFNNLSIQPSVDTIQEFNLLRSTFSTEYGQGQAVVSMVTKSGSNTIHGSAYEFVRSSIFDARNYFSTYTTSPHKPVYHRSQFGGTVGGPIVKDRVFLFGGYEGLRSSQAQPFSGLFPTQAQLAPATQQFAAVFKTSFPVPNCTTCGTNNYSIVSNLVDTYDQYLIRSDQTISSKHTLFERYINYTSAETQPAVQTATSYPQKGQNVSIGDTFLITSSMVNEVRIGYNRTYGYTLPINPIAGKNWVADAGLTNISGGVIPAEYGRPTITISGFTGLGEGGNSQGDTENVFSLGETLSDVVGRHTLRAGFQFQYRQVNQLADTTARGSFTFSSSSAINPATGLPYTALDNFARGFCSACAAGSGTSAGHYRDQTYGVFGNDVWQIGHGLTANLGLRWEYASPFVEKDGLEGSFDPTSGKIAFHKVPATIPTALVPLVNTTPNYFPAGIIQPMKMGFGPRVGIAYQATPTTVVRTGYGIYFDNTNTNELQFTRTVAPLYFQASLTNQFITGLMPGINSISLIPPPFSVSAKNRVPYTQEWTLSVQQDLGHGTLFELAYTGSTTHKLWKRYDQNMGVINQVDGVTPAGASPFPAFGVGMLTSATVGNSSFNGMSAKLEHRSSKGFYYLVNYQWSKNLDNNSGEADSNDTSYSRFFGFDRSYSNFDSPHRSVASWGYQLPFGKGQRWLQSGIGNVVAGGWQLQNIVQLRTGYPFSVTGGSGSCLCGRYVPQRVNLVPGRKTGQLSNPSPFHYFDRTAYYVPGTTPGTFSTAASLIQGTVTRNTLRGPGTGQVDLSAIKNFQIYERLTAQFRAEAFNIINHPNFGNPANNISNNNYGTITGTSTDNRDLQFALKILW
jgi:hypothetical protein